jgi:hypothetical protein
MTSDTTTHERQYPCQSVEWDGGEYVPCRRYDTRHHGVGVWLCPEHANTHHRHG